MSMFIEKEKNRIKVVIPNSEATISAQLKNIKNSEVTGFYTSDKEDYKQQIVSFLKNDYDYFLDVKSVLNVIDTIKNNYYIDYKDIYKDSFTGLDDSLKFFSNVESDYIRIPKMYYSGQNDRYLKFENNDPVVKKMRGVLYGDITGFYIIVDNNRFIISVYVVDNAKEILEKRKEKILNNTTISSGLEKFRNYYINNINNAKEQIFLKKIISEREEFIKEYPLEYLKSMDLNDYALGTNNFKETLCYNLEFGKYKSTGLGIGGGTASKYGIYLGKDGKYYGRKNEVIEDPVEFWENFRYELYEFLESFKELNKFPNMDKYFLISGTPILIIKLCFLYYPTQFVSIGAKDKLLKACLLLDFEMDKNLYAPQISFLLANYIKNNINEVKENDPQYIGYLLWNFIEEYEENYTMREEFKNWLISLNLSESTIEKYLRYNEITSKEAIDDNLINKTIYDITDEIELEELINKLNENEKFNFRKERYNNINTAAINNYLNFLKWKNSIKRVDQYNKQDFLNEVFIDEDKYDSIVSILGKKKNIILEGAPGVGKTFMAKRLAYSILGYIDNNRVKLIQFHQSYSYEDFVEGYRPTSNGFKLEKGIFYKLCKEAENNPTQNYYLIIDEINRGNLSKIFGELLMLIEFDKRGENLTLAYSEESFSVPENLYIIGLMNTADRSLALIDYALRRRFSFIRIEPAFESEKFIKTFNEKFDNKFSNIIEIIKKINEAIEQDKSLGAGFKIGHSYFCPNLKDRKGNKKDIEDIITYEILPLLEEYWYDDPDSIIQWKNALNGVLND